VNIGKQEKAVLDKQEQIDHCNIIRQYPVAGYFVDGYCPETNTVYEVYEPHHDNQVHEDHQREVEIRNQLRCDFRILKITK